MEITDKKRKEIRANGHLHAAIMDAINIYIEESCPDIITEKDYIKAFEYVTRLMENEIIFFSE